MSFLSVLSFLNFSLFFFFLFLNQGKRELNHQPLGWWTTFPFRLWLLCLCFSYFFFSLRPLIFHLILFIVSTCHFNFSLLSLFSFSFFLHSFFPSFHLSSLLPTSFALLPSFFILPSLPPLFPLSFFFFPSHCHLSCSFSCSFTLFFFFLFYSFLQTFLCLFLSLLFSFLSSFHFSFFSCLSFSPVCLSSSFSSSQLLWLHQIIFNHWIINTMMLLQVLEDTDDVSFTPAPSVHPLVWNLKSWSSTSARLLRCFSVQLQHRSENLWVDNWFCFLDFLRPLSLTSSARFTRSLSVNELNTGHRQVYR